MRSVMKQNDPLILTFDFGTQSVRASLFNKKGECVGMEKETYQPAYFSPKPGYAEMDPNDYYDYLCVACKRLVESHQEEIKRVQGIVVDCFRDSSHDSMARFPHGQMRRPPSFVQPFCH